MPPLSCEIRRAVPAVLEYGRRDLPRRPVHPSTSTDEATAHPSQINPVDNPANTPLDGDSRQQI